MIYTPRLEVILKELNLSIPNRTKMFLFNILTQRYYLHTSRESVSPVCGIFEIKVAFIALNKIPTLLCLTEGQPFLRLVVSSRCKCVELIVKVKINE